MFMFVSIYTSTDQLLFDTARQINQRIVSVFYCWLQLFYITFLFPKSPDTHLAAAMNYIKPSLIIEDAIVLSGYRILTVLLTQTFLHLMLTRSRIGFPLHALP